MTKTANHSNSQRRAKVLLVDDHPMVRERLAEAIEREEGLSVCGQAESRHEALSVIKGSHPDLAIIDLTLKASSGLELIKDIRGRWPKLLMLVVSMHDESLYAERAIRAGAMGYVMKHEPPKTFKTAIHRVLGGDMYLSEKMATSLLAKLMRGGNEPEETPVSRLSDRELEVFRLLGQGKGTKQIAQELNLTVNTINSFRTRIKEKLHFKNSTELLLHAIQWVQEEANQ